MSLFFFFFFFFGGGGGGGGGVLLPLLWQSSPAKPALHVHLNFSPPSSVQDAPFLQGPDLHGWGISVLKQKQQQDKQKQQQRQRRKKQETVTDDFIKIHFVFYPSVFWRTFLTVRAHVFVGAHAFVFFLQLA